MVKFWLTVAMVLATPAAAQTAPVEASAIFAVSYSAGPKWKPGVPMRDQGLRDHFFYIKALDDAGRIVIAGPVGDDAGLFLVRAKDQADADAVVSNDPAIKVGIFTGAARPFVPRFVGRTLPAPARP